MTASYTWPQAAYMLPPSGGPSAGYHVPAPVGSARPSLSGISASTARQTARQRSRSGAVSHKSSAVSHLRQRLVAHLRHTAAAATQLELSLTNNQSTMISVRREPGRYRLRLHHMFTEAGPDIVSALCRYVTCAEQAASAELDAFIDQKQALLRTLSAPDADPNLTAKARAQRLNPIGHAHDLLALYQQLNAAYFANTIEAQITWGQRKRSQLPPRLSRSLKLGSYSVEDRLIRIHPTLDRAQVPSYVVAFIIYHEMLHQKHPIPIVAGRRQFHTPQFLAEERLFDDYERARHWQRHNLHWLLIY